jgi:nucleoside-diphosphate-sugar epimerase
MTAAKPLVLITGAGGNIGSALANALQRGYRAVGLDRDGDDTPGGVPVIAVDITSDREVERAAAQHPKGRIRSHYGDWNRRIL